jgi:hypothetical protein
MLYKQMKYAGLLDSCRHHLTSQYNRSPLSLLGTLCEKKGQPYLSPLSLFRTGERTKYLPILLMNFTALFSSTSIQFYLYANNTGSVEKGKGKENYCFYRGSLCMNLKTLNRVTSSAAVSSLISFACICGIIGKYVLMQPQANTRPSALGCCLP